MAKGKGQQLADWLSGELYDAVLRLDEADREKIKKYLNTRKLGAGSWTTAVIASGLDVMLIHAKGFRLGDDGKVQKCRSGKS